MNGHDQQQCSGRLWLFKKCWVGVKKTQSVPRKCYIPHIITTPPAAFKLLIWRRMLFVPNLNAEIQNVATEIKTHRTRQHWIFSRLWTVVYKLYKWSVCGILSKPAISEILRKVHLAPTTTLIIFTTSELERVSTWEWKRERFSYIMWK